MLSVYCIQEDKTIVKRYFPTCVFGDVVNDTVNTFGRCSPLKIIFKHDKASVKKFISGTFEVRLDVHLKTLEMMRDIHYEEYDENILDYYLSNRKRIESEFKQLGNFGLFKWRKHLLEKYREFMNIIRSKEKTKIKDYSPKEFGLYNDVFKGCFNWNNIFVHYYTKELFPYASHYYTKHVTQEHLEVILSNVFMNKYCMKAKEYSDYLELCSFMFSCYVKKFNTFNPSIFKFFNKDLNNELKSILDIICLFVPIEKAFENKNLSFNVLAFYARENFEKVLQYVKDNDKFKYLAKQPFLPTMLSINKETDKIIFLEQLKGSSFRKKTELKFLNDLIKTDLFKMKLSYPYFKKQMEKFLAKNYYVLMIDPYLQQKLKSIVDNNNKMLFT